VKKESMFLSNDFVSKASRWPTVFDGMFVLWVLFVVAVCDNNSHPTDISGAWQSNDPLLAMTRHFFNFTLAADGVNLSSG